MPTNNPSTKTALPQKTVPTTKKPAISVRPTPKQQFQVMVSDMKSNWFGWLRKLANVRNIEVNNYELAHKHLALGNLKDAIFRFRFVTWLNPARADAFYYLGCCRMAAGDRNGAGVALEMALKLKPDYEEAAYIYAVVAGNALPVTRLPKKMPLSLAREFFDSQAANYNHTELQDKDYKGHVLLSNAIRSQYAPGRMDHVILDLGVGTGLCGLLLRDTASHISGVDISQSMITEAMKARDNKDNKAYDALINQDVQKFLTDAPDGGYDVVMAATVFSYIGDLSALFPQVARVMNAGGIFAFTADKGEGDGYRFDGEVARFRYGLPYLERLAASAGLTKVKSEEVGVYPDYPAWLCIFRK